MRATDEASGGDSRLDALLPPEMARRAEEVGVRKAALDATTTFTLAVLAGAFIALGGVFATTALAGSGTAPWGAVRVLAGVAFSVGLVLVVVGGAELFTGNNLIVMAWASRRVSTWALLRNWLIVFAGNFVGAGGTAALVYLAGTHRGGSGAFWTTALAIAHAKVQLGFTQAVALGVLCNTLVCLAVWLTLSARTTADRVLAIVPPISAFVASGFEHSVAEHVLRPVGPADHHARPRLRRRGRSAESSAPHMGCLPEPEPSARDDRQHHRRLCARRPRLLVRLLAAAGSSRAATVTRHPRLHGGRVQAMETPSSRPTA